MIFQSIVVTISLSIALQHKTPYIRSAFLLVGYKIHGLTAS